MFAFKSIGVLGDKGLSTNMKTIEHYIIYTTLLLLILIVDFYDCVKDRLTGVWNYIKVWNDDYEAKNKY